MLTPWDLPWGSRGPHWQYPQVTGVAVFLGHVSWDCMCSLWELDPVEEKKKGTMMEIWILGIRTIVEHRLISALHPNTTSSPGLWLKRLPVGGLTHSQHARGHLRSSHVCCGYVLLRNPMDVFTGHSGVWMRRLLGFVYLLVLVCISREAAGGCGWEVIPVYSKLT